MSGNPAPAVATARARKAALTRHRPADTDALTVATRDLAAANLEDYIRRTVDAAPPLTPEQRDRLAVLLRGAA